MSPPPGREQLHLIIQIKLPHLPLPSPPLPLPGTWREIIGRTEQIIPLETIPIPNEILWGHRPIRLFGMGIT